MTSHPPIPTRVVLLCGPSGTGKSSFATRSGLPVLALDDFYKEGDDPTLPLVPGTSDTDWDAPAAWDAEAALATVTALCHQGRATVPVYDISRSARTGERTLDVEGAPLFIAEGIFAAEIVARCRAAGLLADALCLRGRPSTTFRRRLLRDLRESRKPVPFLLRRGWWLMRAERQIVAHQAELGAHPCTRDEALSRLTAAAESHRPGTGPAAARPDRDHTPAAG
ncbi:ATP-binding protein [Streptomyces sp. NPDC058045]|uniref:ATP-binding protein n=1 Tax=Streptomyces sp. NPDC058045 TaxID=3346311 RepID=UPI0036F11AE5